MTNRNPPEPVGKSPRKQAIEKLIEKSDGEKRVIPAFAIMPACNHDPFRGTVHLIPAPAYSDNPQSVPAYLRCIHCGELMGMIGLVGRAADNDSGGLH
jgi:hypothetical protein